MMRFPEREIIALPEDLLFVVSMHEGDKPVRVPVVESNKWGLKPGWYVQVGNGNEWQHREENELEWPA